jgi:hypothetical protein
MWRGVAPRIAPLIFGAVVAYATTVLGVALRPDECLYHDLFGAAGVGVIEQDLHWLPPAWECSAPRSDGATVRFREAWTVADVAVFAVWTLLLAGGYALIRRRRNRREVASAR